MGIVVFVLLALIATAIVVYPLLPGRAPAPSAPAVTERDIEQAVRILRQTRRQGGLFCPACGKGYQAGDRFCVRCGGELPQAQAAADELLCPSCGAAMRPGDRFCAKCGHHMGTGEVA
jgi:predicted amidophosphoribosyltransferase